MASIQNWSRDLQIPDLVRSNRIDGVVMQRRRQGAYDLDTPCTNYFVSHYKFANGNHDEERRPIDYALCDVSFGVNINKWPDGVDAGPFTKAIRHAFTTGDYAVMLSQVDEYATRHRLGCQLDPDYSDKEFGERWRPFTLQTRKKLREDLNALNYIWDYNDL